MALREITQSRQITATIRLDEKAAFIHALAGDGVHHAGAWVQQGPGLSGVPEVGRVGAGYAHPE